MNIISRIRGALKGGTLPVHYETGRIFDRIAFASIREGEIEVGYGKRSLTLGQYQKVLFVRWE